MPRHLARSALSAALGAVLLVAAACGTDDDDSESQLSADALAACEGYNEIINQWSRDYGAEMGAVGEAMANDDDDRQDESVENVRELFLEAAEGLREHAEATSDEELTEALNQAADGLTEVAGDVESYDDVLEVSEVMSDGEFAHGGEKVNQVCAR